MDNLSERLALIDGTALGTVLHVGAGDGAVVDSFDGRAVESFVLVEGDAESADELRARTQGRADVRVLAAAVAPVAGTLAWHRYNLRKLNGPLDASGLVEVYPRLRQMGLAAIEARALGDVVAEVMVRLDGALPHVLILDTPGQADALLASLPEAALLAFDWIVLVGCKLSLGDGDDARQQGARRLEAACFTSRAGPETETYWPVSVYHFDRPAHERKRARDRIAQLESQLAEVDSGRQALAAGLAERDQRAQQLLVELQAQTERGAALQVECAAAQTATVEWRRQAEHRALALDEQARRGDECDARLRAQQQSVDMLEAGIGERDARVHALQQALAEAQSGQARLQHAASAAEAEGGALRQQLAAMRVEHEQHQRALEEQTRLAAGRKAAADKTAADLQQLRAERDQLAKDKTTLTAARDEQTRLARDARQRVTQLDGELAEVAARHGLLQEELIKAEAQIEFIADLLLRDARE